MARVILLILILHSGNGFFSVACSSAEAASHTEQIIGTIASLRFGDPLQEPYFDLAEIKVVDSHGREVSVLINASTLIRDPWWHNARVTYLQTGMKVKMNYVLKKSEPYEAKEIYMIQEKKDLMKNKGFPKGTKALTGVYI